ncbi:MAG: hypothetical protein RLZ98_1306 [Pseudomonadota bacterium]|jgi:glyoxylase-like metal-dependent hydrolase (beta-lactamase superfamily II)
MAGFRIGDFRVDAILELECAAFGASELFPDLSDSDVAAMRNQLGESYIDRAGVLMMAFRTFVLRTSRHNILIDTCIGNHKDRPDRPLFHRLESNYLEDLAAIGLQPEQIDFVMCTHLHWDHVGWNTRLIDGTWVPTFPNARYVIAEREYRYWDHFYQTEPEGRHARAFSDSVAPVARAGKAVLVDDGYELEPGVWLESCPGHTPGNVAINIRSGDGKGVFAGDILQHPVQLLQPTLSSRPDFDKHLSRLNRLAFLERHAGTGSIVMPTHFPYHAGGRIEPAGTAAYRFDPVECCK